MNRDWTRLSIADLLIMTGCIGLGYAVSRSADVAREAIVGGLLVGMSIAGPALFLHQVWRGRRTRLSAGETLWITPIGLYLALAFTLNFVFQPSGPGELALPIVIIIVSLAVLSVFTIAVTLLGQAAACGRRSIACQWTDITGNAFAASAMATVVFLVSQADFN